MAIEFVNDNPHIVLGPLAELNESTSLTIATWVKFTATNVDMAIAMRGASFSLSAPWLLWRDDHASVSGRTKTLAGVVNTNAGVIRVEASSNLLNDTTTWHHVAMVFEAGQPQGLRLFVDGVKDGFPQSTVGHANLVNDLSDVTIGIDLADKQLTGGIAEFCIWNRALADEEIAALAHGLSPLALPATIDRLATYHDLIRGTNRPGIGAVAASSGTFNYVPHPRIVPRHHLLAHVSSVRSPIAGPYRAASGDSRTADGDAGEVFTTGAHGGTLIPTGEVNS